MSKNADQPGAYTQDQLKDIVGGQDVATRVKLGNASKGSIIRIPLVDPDEEGAHVDYVFDGKDYWHRVDTKAAQLIRNSSTRQVKNRG